jgi:hypothetical protein
MIYLSKRRLIYGVGVNDADFNTGGLQSYKAWYQILCRCYREDDLARRPSYRGCEMGVEWVKFTDFHKWFNENYRQGWQIDKDILCLGNKIYSPEKCVYIPRALNSFVLSNPSRVGDFPLGVSFSKKHKAFKAQIRDGHGGKIFLGHYYCPHEAHLKWHEKKMEQAHEFNNLCDSIHPFLFKGLVKKIESYRKDQP